MGAFELEMVAGRWEMWFGSAGAGILAFLGRWGRMEGRRISVFPGPCSKRRILARKGLCADGFGNSVKKLYRREISSKWDRAFSLSNAHEGFQNIRLQEEFDRHDPKEHWSQLPCFEEAVEDY